MKRPRLIVHFSRFSSEIIGLGTLLWPLGIRTIPDRAMTLPEKVFFVKTPAYTSPNVRFFHCSASSIRFDLTIFRTYRLFFPSGRTLYSKDLTTFLSYVSLQRPRRKRLGNAVGRHACPSERTSGAHPSPCRPDIVGPTIWPQMSGPIQSGDLVFVEGPAKHLNRSNVSPEETLFPRNPSRLT